MELPKTAAQYTIPIWQLPALYEKLSRWGRGFREHKTHSEWGGKINDLDRELWWERSEEAKAGFRAFAIEAAMAGFRASAIEEAERPDRADALRFFQTAERLEESGEIFRESFEVAFKLQEKDLETWEWFDNIKDMDAGEVESYLDVTRGLIAAEEARAEEALDETEEAGDELYVFEDEADDEVSLYGVFLRFVRTVSAITESEELSEDEQQVYLRQLLDEVGELSELETIYDYLDAFRGEVL